MITENKGNSLDFQEKVNALLEAINEPADDESEEALTYKMMLHAIVREALQETNDAQNLGNSK